jgi:membrane associated rhomboid family serine protease
MLPLLSHHQQQGTQTLPVAIFLASSRPFDVLKKVQLTDQIARLPRLIQAMLLVNVVVFVLFQMFPSFMFTNSTSTVANTARGRKLWTLLLSAFSHVQFWHLAGNMLTFSNVGPQVFNALGERSFAFVVLCSALASNLFPVVFSLFVGLTPLQSQAKRMRMRYVPQLGFSGVNVALLQIFSKFHPNSKLSMMGLMANAPDAVSFLLIIDCVGALIDAFLRPTGIAHAGHIGGLLGGWAAQYALMNFDTPSGRMRWRQRISQKIQDIPRWFAQ